MSAPPSSCLTDEVLVELLENLLPDDALARVHRHAAGCTACRTLIATLTPGIQRSEVEDSGPGPADSAPEAAGSWTPPESFDAFRLERLIGRGGMGIVYLAHDTSLDRRVAVKFMAPGQPDARFRELFTTEARALARTQHANIVSVFSVGEVDGHPYIVSEYVVGETLAELPLPVPWRRVLSLGVGLARGLAAAHRQGVLHRDLKPSNALVTPEGEVKLLDFGLAERFDVSGEQASGSPQLVGTLPYLAPEVLAGGPATARSDLYALGLVLHELCTGQVPLRASRLPGETPPRAAPGPDVDPDFAALILRCLAVDPLERFGSVEALGEALEQLERALAPVPMAAGNPYRGLAPFAAEHRALFFGREGDIRAVLERLRTRTLVLVAGESGTGKSSLCRAGVLPRVAAGALDDGQGSRIVTLWPGHRPLEALAAALAPVLGRGEAEVATVLTETPASLGRALRETHARGRGLLLFVDQLEELLTLSDPGQAAHFARLMAELALPSAGVHVLLAVRGDFLTRLCALPGLGDEAERALYVLRPLSSEGVREAIVGPARARGVAFESPELVQALVASTAQGVGSLPLLQFALAELWERRDPARGRITRAALDAMGGVAGALSRHADGVLARMRPAEHAAARRLLLQLVTAEGTRIERGIEDLTDAGDESSRAALRMLVEGRLLHTRTANGLPRWEIAHESLIESWGTLRDWLDDDIGHRVLRKRVEAASTEWERLHRTHEALWGQRQLDEVRLLDASTLGGRDQAFLRASHRAVRRARWRRGLTVFFLALAVLATHGGLRLQAYLEDAGFIAAELDTAREALASGRGLASRALASREESLAMFDGKAPSSLGPETATGPAGLRSAAEKRWTETLALRDQAEAALTRASRSLERGLDRDRHHLATRQLIAEVLAERVQLAEAFHQRRERDEWLRRLEQEVDASKQGGELLERLRAPAEVEFTSTPPGAQVAVERYIPGEGPLHREPVTARGPRLVLPEGSYLLHVTQPGRVPVTLPVSLMHGAREALRLTLPTQVPEGAVYIPPGCFLLGSAEPEAVRRFSFSPPMHRYCLAEGYLIGRTEVTFGDWLTYLEDLPPSAPARRILEQPHFGDGGAITLRWHPGTGWVFTFYRTREEFRAAKEEEPLVYAERTRRGSVDWKRLPLSGVSAQDLEGYLYWLHRTKRLPGARLCGQHEWEYAARGADGRRYPHGDSLQSDDANIDATYDRRPRAFGPDAVGEHPASVSPFGLEDMAGNAYELTRSVTPEFGSVVLRGGSWYYDSFVAASADLSPGDATARDVRIGVRVCASFEPH
ncbi:bifunctional serine/threonine-protein kinase/formylglycine-generating enzyme family protein [Corallococcus sp. Z5C101001]|uniref:bifunctional serine/threonine-protein kinase/formylglycine-generating enzyme family protein n=1 Tax=Corallococcus sp. Z5C101001 TaxID=2596829 RepID=UPI00117C98D9|nr:bifunctional serine/threonine-protein kinase/formylglycine-generating enzyme family protein [Corallococcus sp. Z5C101001]TSC23522.1 protein kinase [Corallococcus sp. Z5C101001]